MNHPTIQEWAVIAAQPVRGSEYPLDPFDVIDRSRISALQVWVLAICLLTAMFDGFNTQAPAFIGAPMAKEWGIPFSTLGLVFSAALIGSVIGTSYFGVLADRVGRKPLVIVSLLIFGALTPLCAWAGRADVLVVLRFLAGIGLGGAMPNLMALASEYAPARKRTTLVTVTLWGFPLGAVFGGLAASWMIGQFGWRSVFYLGGVAPLLLAGLAVWMLPESPRFLALANDRSATLARILGHITGEPVRTGYRFTMPPTPRGSGLGRLKQEGLLDGAILLSVTSFASLLLTYLLISWVPTLLVHAGVKAGDAVLGTVVLNMMGIVGSFFIARATDGKSYAASAMSAGYIVAAAATWAISAASGSFLATLLALSAGGFFLIGTQIAVVAYTASYFPTYVRGAGIGLVQAVGRTGSLIGPIVAGVLLAHGMTHRQLLLVGIAPALVAAGALAAMNRVTRRSTSAAAS
jgi:AAHS family 4-hydroxybenzoate transporter-like MFS transporter